MSAILLEKLADEDNDLYLSAASSWEIAIKYRLGKLPLPESPAQFILSRLSRDGIISLPIEHGHTVLVADLPDFHNDPFDRLLIAQALSEGMTLVSADKCMAKYDVPILWA